MTVTTQQRHAQLQAQMTVCLDSLRRKVASQMIDTVKRMQNRPRVAGSDKLPQLGQDSRLHNDDSGSLLISAVAGIPGLSAGADIALDMAVDTHDARQAQKRTQDDQVLSFKQIRKIQEDNARDMKLFRDLDEKLNLVNTYIMSGYDTGVTINGSLHPFEKGSEQTLEKKDEKYTADNQNYRPKAYGPKFAA